MICRVCKHEVSSDLEECPNCGSDLTRRSSVEPSPVPDNRPSAIVHRPMPDNKPSAIVHRAMPESESPTYKKALQNWWKQLLKNNGQYKAYAFFLCLPSDVEAINYLSLYGKEVDILSNENCLVIALGKNTFKRSGFDDKSWKSAIDEQVSEGYSLTVSRLFNIKFTDFPCIILFEDIHSPKKVTFTFKDLTTAEISGQMRTIFSLVQQAINEKAKPIAKLEKHQKASGLKRVRETIFEKILFFSGKTFETAMEVWIKNTIT